MKKTIILLVALSVAFQLNAQKEDTPSPIIFIYDASGSMWGQMQGKTKMEIASNVLSTSVNNLPDNQKVGLVAYGHRKKGDCKDVEFLVDVSSGTKPEVNLALRDIKPLGKTPLAYSATQVINKLRASKEKATIILVTDGIESCNGNICDVVQMAKKEGINFKLHIIGFGIKAGETEQLKCAARAGNGNYYDAADAGGLGDVLNEATSQTVDKPKGNVSVYAVKNGKPVDVLVTAYDVIAKRTPISVRTYRDTAYFYLPPSKYNFEASPLEGSDVNMITLEGIESFDDKIVHQDISFDGGVLGITTTNNGENWDCIVKVYTNEGEVAASQRTYNSLKEVEVDPGTYKISIQALGNMKGLETYTEIDNLSINAGETTAVSYNFISGSAFIDATVDGNSIDTVVNINEINTGKNVANGRTYNRGKEFLLNPGTYNVKVVPLGDHKNLKSQLFTIEVKKGEKTNKTLNF